VVQAETRVPQVLLTIVGLALDDAVGLLLADRYA